MVWSVLKSSTCTIDGGGLAQGAKSARFRLGHKDKDPKPIDA